MGNDMTFFLPPWLDRASMALVRDLVSTLSIHRGDLLAILLYGSIARHDERPLTEPDPSDIDLFLIFDLPDVRAVLREERSLQTLLGQVDSRHLDAQREVKCMFASASLAEWDPAFLANLARDALPLVCAGSLPSPLTQLPL